MKEWDEKEKRDDNPMRFFANMKPVEVHKGKVYYDPRTNQFIQIREIGPEYARDNFANYYSDCQTQIDSCSVPISEEYFSQLEEVKDITKYADHTNCGWCVRKRE